MFPVSRTLTFIMTAALCLGLLAGCRIGASSLPPSK